MRLNALKCLLCGDIIYSRTRHDFRSCSCGNCYVDGGFDYMRYGGKEIDKVKDVKITVKRTIKELYEDWNLKKDKYGLIKGILLDGEIKKGLKSGKPEPVYKGKKSLFAQFLDAIFANAKKYPEKLHSSEEVWDKEWGKLLKGSNKMEKSIKKGIQDVKEGKVAKVNDIDKMFKEIEEKRKRHPVYYFFHDLYYRVYRFIDGTPLRIKTFIQRGKRGWASSDTWGFDYYLAKVISEGVRNLKEHIHGMPNNLTEGQWIDILNKITYTFELAKRMTENELYLIKDKKQRIKWQKTLDEINKKHGNNDRCMTHKEIREYEEGWRLFKIYFFSLWD